MMDKIIMISCPGMSFIYVFVMLAVVSKAELTELSLALANAHMIGSIPGIILSYFHSSNAYYPEKVSIINKHLIVYAVLLMGGCFFQLITKVELLVVVSAFVATYSDGFFKQYSPKSIIASRRVQLIVWVIITMAVYLVDFLNNYYVLLVGRSIGYVSIVIGYKNIGPAAISVKKTNINKFLWPIAMASWLIGSNVIFVFPVYIINSSPVLTHFDSIVSYISQISLQLAGRISDYITAQVRLNKEIKRWEVYFASISVCVGLLGVAICKLGGINNLSVDYIVAICFLSASVILWGGADSIITTNFYEDNLKPKRAILFGLAVAVLSLLFWIFVKTVNQMSVATTASIYIAVLSVYYYGFNRIIKVE